MNCTEKNASEINNTLKKELLSYSYDELEALLVSLGEPK